MVLGAREASLTAPLGRSADRVPNPLTGRTVVCISSIDWRFLWQGHQEIMSRFAAAGSRVLYVENSGVRSVRAGDLGRIIARIARWIGQRGGTAVEPRSGVTLVSPLLLPFPTSRLARSLNQRVLLPRLAARLRALGAADPILFTFLPTPNAARLIELLRTPRSRVVYYCIADFRELSDLGHLLDETERRLVREADLVFVQGPAFHARFAGLNERIHEFAFGVNLEVFDPSRAVPSPELGELPRPILGYSGGVHRHVDVGVLAALADRFPGGSVVVVGPLQQPIDALRGRDNVHLLGKRPFAELPSLLAAFDVALIPYIRSAYTDTVFPTKLFEYLAMGIPVVSTDLPEVRRQGLPEFAVRLAEDVDGFLDAVAAATRDDPGLAPARTELARPRDWKVIVRQMADLIAESASG